ncbi:hypothetical protein ABH920_001119 [Catenulispora sp. EB89]|uniref:DUF2142 domain-containing protein n=1 Tax=Catenulispora sp. EB89 TaxID=3156257 RepID=UPI003514D3DD
MSRTVPARQRQTFERQALRRKAFERRARDRRALNRQAFKHQSRQALVRRTWLSAFAAFALLAVAWSLAMPPDGTTDERQHLERAYGAVTGHLLAPQGEDPLVHRPGAAFEVPKSLLPPNALCVYFPNYHQDESWVARAASCQHPAPATHAKVRVVSWVGRYNPLYYLAVGGPLRFWPDLTGILLSRILAALLASAFVAAAAMVALRTRRPLLLAALLTVLTPTTIALNSTVNPNGVEISAAVLLWVCMVDLARPGAAMRASAGGAVSGAVGRRRGGAGAVPATQTEPALAAGKSPAGRLHWWRRAVSAAPAVETGAVVRVGEQASVAGKSPAGRLHWRRRGGAGAVPATQTELASAAGRSPAGRLHWRRAAPAAENGAAVRADEQASAAGKLPAGRLHWRRRAASAAPVAESGAVVRAGEQASAVSGSAARRSSVGALQWRRSRGVSVAGSSAESRSAVLTSEPGSAARLSLGAMPQRVRQAMRAESAAVSQTALLALAAISGAVVLTVRAEGPFWFALAVCGSLLAAERGRVRELLRWRAGRLVGAAWFVIGLAAVAWNAVSGNSKVTRTLIAVHPADHRVSALLRVVAVNRVGGWFSEAFALDVPASWAPMLWAGLAAVVLIPLAMLRSRRVVAVALGVAAASLGITVVLEIKYLGTLGWSQYGRYFLPGLAGTAVLLASGPAGELSPVLRRRIPRLVVVGVAFCQLWVLAVEMTRVQAGPNAPLNPLAGSWHPAVGSLVVLVVAGLGAVALIAVVWAATAAETSSATPTRPVPTAVPATGPSNVRTTVPAAPAAPAEPQVVAEPANS